MSSRSSSRLQHMFLLGSLIAALALRLWGINFGLPYSYVDDEYHEVMRAMALGAGSFDLGRTGKGGFYLLLFAEYGVYFILLTFLGIVNSAREFAIHFVQDPTPFYLMGRVTAALVGTLSVLVAFLLGQRAYATGAGMLAAVFLTVNVLHVDLSRVIGVDVLMTCFAMAALLMAISVAGGGGRKEYAMAGLFAALATTTKTPAIILVVPLLIAHTYAISRVGGGLKAWLVSRHLWIGSTMFVTILLATNPGLLLYGHQYFDLFSVGFGGRNNSLALQEGVLEVYGRRPNLFRYYANSLQSSMGWPLMIVCSLGVIYGTFKRTQADVILISFSVIFFVAIASTSSQHLYYERYVLPPLAVMLILGARVVYDSGQRLRDHGGLGVVLFTGALVAWPTYMVAHIGYVLTQMDTRTLAKEWIDENVPQGASIFIEGSKIAPIRSGVHLLDTAERLGERIAYWSIAEPRQAEFLKFKLEGLEGPAFNLELTFLTEIETLDYYAAKGVEYFVIIPDRHLEHRNRTPKAEQLLHELRSGRGVIMIKRFEADLNRRPGPTVEIYQTQSAKAGLGQDLEAAMVDSQVDER